MDYRRRRAGKAIKDLVIAIFDVEALSQRPQLPERVEAAIRSEQDRSEILMSWIQRRFSARR